MGNRRRVNYSPKKVVPTEQLALPTETLLGEMRVAVVTPDALGVPRSVQHIQQELIQDGFVAGGARDDHVAGGRVEGRRGGRSAPRTDALVPQLEVRRQVVLRDRPQFVPQDGHGRGGDGAVADARQHA
jgi:hypothetical protein